MFRKHRNRCDRVLAWENAACLREAIDITTTTGATLTLDYCLVYCGHLCVAAGRWAEAITLWAAHDRYLASIGVPDEPEEVRRREEPMRKAEQVLGAARTRAEQERGAAMTLKIAAEFAAMLIAANLDAPPAPAGAGQLSTREQELVTLVAQGRTDTQIAAQLYISVRTVRTHLERIRDKTGCRRRADLTRLALQAQLV